VVGGGGKKGHWGRGDAKEEETGGGVKPNKEVGLERIRSQGCKGTGKNCRHLVGTTQWANDIPNGKIQSRGGVKYRRRAQQGEVAGT